MRGAQEPKLEPNYRLKAVDIAGTCSVILKIASELSLKGGAIVYRKHNHPPCIFSKTNTLELL